MRVLVTGGAGYIGAITCAQLLEAGHDATVLDDLSAGHRGAVPRGARFVEVNLLDRDRLRAVLDGGFDAVLHFAAKALVAESMEAPELYWHTNILGSLNLLDAMRSAGVGRIVFSSTCAVYGEPETQPIGESAPTRPTNAYGASKLAVDNMLSFQASAHGLAATSLRYFNVAGADRGLGENHEPETHLIPLVLMAAAGRRPVVELNGVDYPTPDGTAVRDYVHVRDLAKAHLLALDALEPSRHRILNLGSGTGYSVREVIEAAARVTGRQIAVVEAARRPGDPPVLTASNRLVAEVLGWSPESPLEAMIADAWTLIMEGSGSPG